MGITKSRLRKIVRKVLSESKLPEDTIPVDEKEHLNEGSDNTKPQLSLNEEASLKRWQRLAGIFKD
jgi:hypothetical protein